MVAVPDEEAVSSVQEEGVKMGIGCMKVRKRKKQGGIWNLKIVVRGVNGFEANGIISTVCRYVSEMDGCGRFGHTMSPSSGFQEDNDPMDIVEQFNA